MKTINYRGIRLILFYASYRHPPPDSHPVGILPSPASPHNNGHSPKGGHHPHSPHMRTGHSPSHNHGSSPHHGYQSNSHHGHNGHHHHHHHGAVLKNTGAAADEGQHHHGHTLHATGHHHSDGRSMSWKLFVVVTSI